MRVAVVGGLVLGLMVEGWTYVMGFTGWYRHPLMVNAFWLVIFIQIAIVIAVLYQTRLTRSYGRQIGMGLLTSLVAGLIIIPGSILFTTVAFPNYFEELRTVQEEMLRQAGQSPEAIRAAMESARASESPLLQALAGALGTLVTGLIISALTAVWLRQPREQLPAA